MPEGRHKGIPHLEGRRLRRKPIYTRKIKGDPAEDWNHKRRMLPRSAPPGNNGTQSNATDGNMQDLPDPS